MALFDITYTPAPAHKGLSLAYIVNIDDVETLPGRTANPTTPAQRVTIVGNIELKPSKVWTKVYVEPEKGGLEQTTEGDTNQKTPVTKVTIFIPGDTQELQAWSEAVMNGNFLILVKTGCESTPRLIGTLCDPARSISNQKMTGMARGDEQGLRVEFECINAPQSWYNGNITLTPTP